ncbi:hypothetical protein [Cellulomonas sp. P24]|uniref:hypothetical protein n=1 Tax=Cellulomonas sp. P24 TaxID=2885206 RepID=UPI00216AB97C|nr:hypothetical protein [Cellulomonas sp. P24]MCR6493931.1 hypothetical protein [Cellulomonas sp. P24]
MTSAGSSGQAPEPTRDDRPSTAADVFRMALRSMLWLLVVLTVVGGATGWATRGLPGVWGALIGVGITLVFSGTTVVAMLRTAESSATTTAAVVLGSWLAKMLVVIVVLAVIRDQVFFDHAVLAAVLAVGVVGSALLDFRAVQRGRVPYVETMRRPESTDGPGREDGRR